MTQHYTLRLAQSRMIAPTVRHLAFERADGEVLRFIPGQFLQLHFEHEGRQLKRSYSLANHHGDPANPGDLAEIAVSYVEGGAATALLSRIGPGDSVLASGPYGRFCLADSDSNRRYLLIATGTGVTPYRAMLPLLEAQVRERGIEVVLLYGARRPVELLYAEEFEALAARLPGFRYLPALSREARDPAGPHDARGYVQDQLAALAPDPARDIAYLCGNPDMVDACFARLKDYGLPIPAIRREKYVSPPDPRRSVAAAATGAAD